MAFYNVPWRRQPQVIVEGSNPFYPGIVRLVYPHQFYDSVSHFVSSYDGTPVLRQTKYGVAYASDSGGSNQNLIDNVVLNDWTVFWYGAADTVDAGTAESLFATDDFGESDISTNRDGFILYNRQPLSGTGLAEAYVNGTGSFTSVGMTSGTYHAVVFTRKDIAFKVYLDGAEVGNFTVGSGANRTYQFLRLGAHRFSGSNQQRSTASHLVFGVANECWDQRHIASFAANPFGVYSPLPARLRFGIPPPPAEQTLHVITTGMRW